MEGGEGGVTRIGSMVSNGGALDAIMDCHSQK